MLCAAGLTQSNPLLTEYLQLGRLCPVSMELFHQVINCPTSENGEGGLAASACTDMQSKQMVNHAHNSFRGVADDSSVAMA